MDVVLGIETSCDETAAGVLAGGKDVLSNVVASQNDLHAKFRGVVPEIASRAHIERINLIVREALERAQIKPEDIAAIASTNRPGLIGCLLIGLTAAKTLAWAWGRPFVAVDHVQAHALSPGIGLDEPPLPAVALVVSGGHTSLMLLRDCATSERLGKTRDDAAGEAYDKVASILGLGYPGGPIIDRMAKGGDPKAVQLPRTWLEPDSLDFSFSGIKTAVLYHVHGPGKTSGGFEKLTEQHKADICASFQAAVVDVLVGKTMRAVQQTGVRTVMVGGGVAANSALRARMQEECEKRRVQLHLAQRTYCTDNGAMIAYLGWQLYKRGMVAALDVTATPTV
jgi:N6-L-threonylcarbamoyladenine synthase